MGEIKIGDLVEVVGHSLYYSKGDRFEVAELLGKSVADYNGIAVVKTSIRSVKETEAEKRGAKFGVTGVVKATGSKWVFACEVEGFWRGIAENGVIVSGEPHQFRLDHEPEYKEIPFSEATDEQRMDHEAVNFEGYSLSQVLKTHPGAYILQPRSIMKPIVIDDIYNTTATVRVPA